MPPPIVLHRFEANAFVRATLLKRYKRFLADVHIAGGGSTSPDASANADAKTTTTTTTTVHCPNTGPMIGLLEHLPAPARLSIAANTTTRKYKHTLEMIRRGGTDAAAAADNNADATTTTNPPVWVGVRSSLANALAGEMLANGLLDEALGGPFERIEREVAYGAAKGKAKGAAPASRVDFVLHRFSAACSSEQRPPTVHLEVKSVTLAEGDLANLQAPKGEAIAAGVVGVFPDTISERASRHMRELAEVAQRHGGGKKDGSGGDEKTGGGNTSSSSSAAAAAAASPAAACLFVIQRGDVSAVAPAWTLDYAYGEAVREAAAAGVAMVAARCRVEAGGSGEGEGEEETTMMVEGGAILFDGLVPVLVERGAEEAALAHQAVTVARAKKRVKK